MPDLRPVFFVIGLMSTALGLLMFVPMAVDYGYGDESWQAFAVSGLLVTLIGGALAAVAFKLQGNENLDGYHCRKIEDQMRSS